MDNAPFWFLVITALAIPVGNAIFAGILGLVGARIGRNATQYSAELQASVSKATTEYSADLQAAQRRRDVELAQLRDAQAELLTAATAVQSFVWYAEKRVKLGIPITTEEWVASRPLLEPAIHGAQRLRAIAQTLPSDSLRDVYVEVERLIFRVVRDGIDEWHKSVENQPDAITRAVSATAGEIRELLQTYPGEAPVKPGLAQLTSERQNRRLGWRGR